MNQVDYDTDRTIELPLEEVLEYTRAYAALLEAHAALKRCWRSPS